MIETTSLHSRLIRMDPEVWQALDTLAEENNTNASDEIRRAVALYLRRHGHKVAIPAPMRARRGQGRRPSTKES